MYKIILVLGLGLLLFVAPMARADLFLDASWRWNNPLTNVQWSTVTDTYPGNAWLLPIAERQASLQAWSIVPPTYPIDGSLWNTHWSATGLTGDLFTSGNSTILKVGNSLSVGGEIAPKHITVQWYYDGTTAMGLTGSGQFGLTLEGFDALNNPVTTTFLSENLSDFKLTPPIGANNGEVDLSFTLSPLVAWEKFTWVFPATGHDHLVSVGVKSYVDVVPEPSSIAFLLMGLPFVGLLRRRKAA